MKFTKNSKKIILFYSLTIIIFGIIFSRISVNESLEILKKTSIYFLSIALFLRAINMFLQAGKLKLILGYLGLSIKLKELVFLGVGSFPLKILLPMKSGELVQAFYLKRKKGFPIKKGILSLILRAIFDFLVLVLFIIFGIIILKINIFEMRYLFLIIFLFVIAAMLLILVFNRKYLFKIYEYYRMILTFFRQIQKKRMIFLFMLIIYSMIFHLTTFLICFFVFKSLSINVPFKEILLFMPIIFILIQIPITISGFGAREALIMYFFLKYASVEALLSAGILISLVIYIIPAIIGLFFQKKVLEDAF